ncbi:MAG: hypothetical protein MIO93_11330 [ANME-2 cluster archaeon]|jgi:hypothetical protein|nr:hypothetical protein [ANME-2 cluster archaeon]
MKKVQVEQIEILEDFKGVLGESNTDNSQEYRLSLACRKILYIRGDQTKIERNGKFTC